jgi:hypothetical protein
LQAEHHIGLVGPDTAGGQLQYVLKEIGEVFIRQSIEIIEDIEVLVQEGIEQGEVRTDHLLAGRLQQAIELLVHLVGGSGTRQVEHFRERIGQPGKRGLQRQQLASAALPRTGEGLVKRRQIALLKTPGIVLQQHGHVHRTDAKTFHGRIHPNDKAFDGRRQPVADQGLQGLFQRKAAVLQLRGPLLDRVNDRIPAVEEQQLQTVRAGSSGEHFRIAGKGFFQCIGIGRRHAAEQEGHISAEERSPVGYVQPGVIEIYLVRQGGEIIQEIGDLPVIDGRTVL